jgi:hypothetical protein
MINQAKHTERDKKKHPKQQTTTTRNLAATA